jgi:hypothetical protein
MCQSALVLAPRYYTLIGPALPYLHMEVYEFLDLLYLISPVTKN